MLDDSKCITYKNNDNIIKEWYTNGKLHRDYKPSIIFYDKNEIVTKEEWYMDNLLHRRYGPAVIWYENKERKQEIWYMYGELHRVDGPAVIEYKDGKGIKETWYRDDKKISNDEIRLSYMGELNDVFCSVNYFHSDLMTIVATYIV